MNEIQNFTEIILKFIATDKMPQAIRKCHALLKESPILTEFVLRYTRHYAISRAIRHNTIDTERINIEKAKVRRAIMDIVYQIENGSKNNTSIAKEMNVFLKNSKFDIDNNELYKETVDTKDHFPNENTNKIEGKNINLQLENNIDKEH